MVRLTDATLVSCLKKNEFIASNSCGKQYAIFELTKKLTIFIFVKAASQTPNDIIDWNIRFNIKTIYATAAVQFVCGQTVFLRL